MSEMVERIYRVEFDGELFDVPLTVVEQIKNPPEKWGDVIAARLEAILHVRRSA